MATPSEQMTLAAQQTLLAHDDMGRALTVRRLGALDRLRLFKAIGADLAQNPPYLGLAMLASSVTALDGVPVPAPVTEWQVEALIQRLGDAGIAAVAECLSKENETGVATDPGNLAGTPIW